MTTTDTVNNQLRLLSEAPSSQIDARIALRLYNLINQSPATIVTALNHILTECAEFAFASDFAMVFLENAWKEAKRLEKSCLN